MTSDIATTNMIDGKVVRRIFIGLLNNPMPPKIHNNEDKMTICGKIMPHPDLNAMNKNNITSIALNPIKSNNSSFIFLI